MTFISIKQANTKDGFTVTELIIVIVVIAILASIMLVSYASVQNQSKAESARTNAASVKSVAEGYYSQNNAYPTQRAHFSTTYITMPTDIILLSSGSLTAATGEKSIMYRYISSGTGACVLYWNFAPDSGSPGITAYTLLGNATTGTCNTTTGTLPI